MTNNDGNTEIITNMEEAVRQGRISKDHLILKKLSEQTLKFYKSGNTIIEKHLSGNAVLQTQEEVQEDRSSVAYRIETCKNCDRLNTLKFCKECGCFMPAKVRIKSASCPIGKWGKAS